MIFGHSAGEFGATQLRSSGAKRLVELGVWASKHTELRGANPEDAASMGLCTIKRSSEFQRVRGGARAANASFVIETRARAAAAVAACHGPRFGFTVTRKIGNAVIRNRIRRRFKEALRGLDAGIVRPGHDYVLVARAGVIEQPFAELSRLLVMTIAGLHQPPRSRTGGNSKPRPDSQPSRPKPRHR